MNSFSYPNFKRNVEEKLRSLFAEKPNNPLPKDHIMQQIHVRNMNKLRIMSHIA